MARLLDSVGGDGDVSPAGARAIRDRALLELLYAAGLRISEALRLDGEDLSFDGGFVRVIGKGDRERLVPVGDVALAWLRRYADDVRPAWLAIAHVEPVRGGPVFLTRARPPAGPPAGLVDREAGGRRGRASTSGSRRTRSGTRSRPTSWRAEPTCASFRSCSDMRPSARRSCTPT